MSGNVIKSKILHRIDTEDNWNLVDPVLSAAEIVFSKTSNGTKMKLGENKAYSQTPFFQDIPTDLSSFTNGPGYTVLSDLQSKSSISVDGVPSDLKVVHIAEEDYAELIDLSAIQDDTIYVVSSDCIDARGQQLKGLADATDLSDAVNLRQLQEIVGDIETILNSI